MSYVCYKDNTKETQKLFLILPNKIYHKNLLTQNENIEEEILNNKHILSNDFTIIPFVVTNENNKPLARCILTYYPNDTNAYVGFYECIENIEVSNFLLNQVVEQAKKDDKTSLIGPLDCSFWIKYRFKINHFNTVYTGEPYNMPYYPKFWKEFGFKVTDNYFSNHWRIPTNNDKDEKCIKRYNRAYENYDIISPTNDTFDKCLEDLYSLLTKLYSTFPTYKHITKDQFCKLFSSLKYVLNYEMVKLAYKENNLVGFAIAIPNYENNTNGKLTLNKFIKILKTKKHPKEYIMLYLGADFKHLGLGGAFAEIAKRHLEQNKLTAYAALIHDGKLSDAYYKQLVYEKSEYELYKYEL